MQTKLELTADTLGLSIDELRNALLDHVEQGIQSYDDFHRSEDDRDEDTVSGRTSVQSGVGQVGPGRWFIMRLVDVEDEDGAPLPELDVVITVRTIDDLAPS